MTSTSRSPQDHFTPEDLRQLKAAGIGPEEAALQLQRLREGVKPAVLLRPCILEDGLVSLPDDLEGLEEEFR